MASDRMYKIDELIKNEVSIELRRIFPDQIISVTKAQVTKDLSFAKIWVSTLQNAKDVAEDCQNEAYNIRKELSKRVELRKIPKLHFVPDETETKAEKIDQLLEQVKKEEK